MTQSQKAPFFFNSVLLVLNADRTHIPTLICLRFCVDRSRHQVAEINTYHLFSVPAIRVLATRSKMSLFGFLVAIQIFIQCVYIYIYRNFIQLLQQGIFYYIPPRLVLRFLGIQERIY